MRKDQASIAIIRSAMSDGTTFHLQRGETIYRVLTLNGDGSGTIRTNEIQPVATWFTDEELAGLASLAKGWNHAN